MKTAKLGLQLFGSIVVFTLLPSGIEGQSVAVHRVDGELKFVEADIQQPQRWIIVRQHSDGRIGSRSFDNPDSANRILERENSIIRFLNANSHSERPEYQGPYPLIEGRQGSSSDLIEDNVGKQIRSLIEEIESNIKGAALENIAARHNISSNWLKELLGPNRYQYIESLNRVKKNAERLHQLLDGIQTDTLNHVASDIDRTLSEGRHSLNDHRRLRAEIDSIVSTAGQERGASEGTRETAGNPFDGSMEAGSSRDPFDQNTGGADVVGSGNPFAEDQRQTQERQGDHYHFATEPSQGSGSQGSRRPILNSGQAHATPSEGRGSSGSGTGGTAIRGPAIGGPGERPTTGSTRSGGEEGTDAGKIEDDDWRNELVETLEDALGGLVEHQRNLQEMQSQFHGGAQENPGSHYYSDSGSGGSTSQSPQRDVGDGNPFTDEVIQDTARKLSESEIRAKIAEIEQSLARSEEIARDPKQPQFQREQHGNAAQTLRQARDAYRKALELRRSGR